MATRIEIGNSEQAIRRARVADFARRQLVTTILSRPIDFKRKRWNQVDVPALMKGSTLHMVTNTSQASRVARQFVEIDFLQFSAAMARPATAQ